MEMRQLNGAQYHLKLMTLIGKPHIWGMPFTFTPHPKVGATSSGKVDNHRKAIDCWDGISFGNWIVNKLLILLSIIHCK